MNQVAIRAESEARTRIARLALLATCVVATILLVVVGARHSSLSVLYVLVATAAGGVLAMLETRRRVLGPQVVVAAIAIVFAAAVLTPPRTSNDLWSYTMYGRMVSVHGVSPYAHTPHDFLGDPFLARVSPIWRHRASVFGPLWVGWSAVGATVAGNSALASRLFFQLTAAGIATAVLVLVWRRTRSPAALIWLGLQPAFGAVAVNGGHNDLVIGLAILAAALAVSGRRAIWAGVAIGVAALVKVTALLALVGIVIWLWRRDRLRAALVAVAACAATLVVGYLPFIADASHVLSGADHTVTAGSPWNGLADLVLGSDAGRAFAHPLAPNDFLEALFVAGAATLVIVALVAGWAVARRARDARRPAGTTTAAYTMAAEYSFPWYCAWALPCFADGAPDALAWIVWIQAAVMLAALKLTTHPNGTIGDILVRWPVAYLATPLLLVAFVVAAVRPGVTDASRPSTIHLR